MVDSMKQTILNVFALFSTMIAFCPVLHGAFCLKMGFKYSKLLVIDSIIKKLTIIC